MAFEPPDNFIIEVIGYVIDLFFWLDILLCFRVSYITFDGEEVTNWRYIAIRYIFQGTFIFDLLSVLPFDAILPGNNSAISLLGILKLIRIKRLPDLIARLNMDEASKAMFKVAQITFYLILYIHLVTCSWWYTVNSSQVWIPPMNILDEETFIYIKGSIMERYWTSFHVAVMCFTGNEMYSRTNFELAVSTFFILNAYLVNGTLFG